MSFFRELWQASVERALGELPVAIRMAGAFSAVFLMLIGELAWAWVVMGMTGVLWLGAYWVGWRRSGARQSDVFGASRWNDDWSATDRAGLRSRQRQAPKRRRWP